MNGRVVHYKCKNESKIKLAHKLHIKDVFDEKRRNEHVLAIFKKLNSSMSKEGIAKLLQQSPEALKAFEKTYAAAPGRQ